MQRDKQSSQRMLPGLLTHPAPDSHRAPRVRAASQSHPAADSARAHGQADSSFHKRAPCDGTHSRTLRTPFTPCLRHTCVLQGHKATYSFSRASVRPPMQSHTQTGFAWFPHTDTHPTGRLAHTGGPTPFLSYTSSVTHSCTPVSLSHFLSSRAWPGAQETISSLGNLRGRGFRIHSGRLLWPLGP